MILPYLNPIRTSLPLLLALTVGASLHGQSTIVSWGESASIVASDINLSKTGALNLGTLASPAVGVNYYSDNTGKTPSFYGTADGTVFRIKNGTPDTIFTTGNGISQENMIALWTQDMFMDGLNTGDVSLTSLSANIFDNGSTINTQSRWVIRLDNTFYASQTFGEGSTTLNDPTSVSWFAYDPLNDYTSVGAAASLPDFSGLTAVGIYIKGSRSTAGTIQLNLSNFSAMGAVPEPSTYAFVAGGLALLLAVRRNRKQ